MSSNKNRKSKSKGREGIAGQFYYDGLYDVSRRSFMDLPPATTVRPMRVVRARVTAAHEAVDRAIRAGVKAGLDWAGIADATAAVQAELFHQLNVYKQARAFAKAGNGPGVHLAAR